MKRITIAFLAISVGLIAFYFLRDRTTDSKSVELRVLAYSSFIASWGPGPSLAEMFEAEMRAQDKSVKVVFLQAEDAGMLLAKTDVFPTDVVLGFDQLGLRRARAEKKWLAHGVPSPKSATGLSFGDEQFFAFDWAPVGFVYREGEIEPPENFEDLLDVRFKNAIALQDPRSSSPGFQFLSWLVQAKGEDEAFRYLARLKPNVHSVSASWSQAYGVFTRGLAKLTLSYATSILYHRLSEKDDRYRFAVFSTGHPAQIEYVGIPSTCESCELAKKFVLFLSGPAAQKQIMSKNWMLPTVESAYSATPFEDYMKQLGLGNQLRVEDLALRSGEPAPILKRWREVGL